MKLSNFYILYKILDTVFSGIVTILEYKATKLGLFVTCTCMSPVFSGILVSKAKNVKQPENLIKPTFKEHTISSLKSYNSLFLKKSFTLMYKVR